MARANGIIYLHQLPHWQQIVVRLRSAAASLFSGEAQYKSILAC